MDQPPTHCPRCASTRIKPILETNYGWYWRCEQCAEIWHHDTRPRPKLFEQRGADLLDALWAFLAFDIDFIRLKHRPRRSA
jgi:hypothetical protein